MTPKPNAKADIPSYDVLILGAGFSGMYSLIRCRELGLRALVVERAAEVGGTWYWNRYPGARCDIESVDYSYSFSDKLQQSWRWSERFAAQPEILSYAKHVADRFDLRRDIAFNTSLRSAAFDEVTDTWNFETDAGELYQSRFFMMATGPLTKMKVPDIPGIEDFQGQMIHTARWPEEGCDFTGKTVAVLGTGSTALQAIPRIAQDAEHLFVLQRTPAFSMPARNRPFTEAEVAEVRRTYGERRALARTTESGVPVHPPTKSAHEMTSEERERAFEAGWANGGLSALSAQYTDYFTDAEANEFAADFARRQIREIVKDPVTADALCPTDYPIGTRRTCVDTGYFETYNRDNVTLVDLRKTPLVGFTGSGFRTSTESIDIDVLVLATGFDAITGGFTDLDVRGVNGSLLRESLLRSPIVYLGVACSGFPNLFLVNGPGSSAPLSNFMTTLEQSVEWITDLMAHSIAVGATRVEATSDAQISWADHVADSANQTLYPRARSWYNGDNIEGKPRVFLAYVGGVGTYRKKCEEVARSGYIGFDINVDASLAASAAR